MIINSKLTKEDIVRIFTGTESRQHAAKLFGVNPTSVDRIRGGKWHRNITQGYHISEATLAERKINAALRSKADEHETRVRTPAEDVLSTLWGGAFMWLNDNLDKSPDRHKAQGTRYGIS